MPLGDTPTLKVIVAMLVTPLITETVLSPEFAT